MLLLEGWTIVNNLQSRYISFELHHKVLQLEVTVDKSLSIDEIDSLAQLYQQFV